MIAIAAIHHPRWIFVYFALITLTLTFACSQNSEQTDVQERPSKELQAKLVYYALPG